MSICFKLFLHGIFLMKLLKNALVEMTLRPGQFFRVLNQDLFNKFLKQTLVSWTHQTKPILEFNRGIGLHSSAAARVSAALATTATSVAIAATTTVIRSAAISTTAFTSARTWAGQAVFNISSS